MNTGEIIREARLTAGLTQRDLARRLGVTQGAVARFESASANPTVKTLERVLRATGHQPELRARPIESSIDVTLLQEALALSPAERIERSERLLNDAQALAAAGARSR